MILEGLTIDVRSTLRHNGKPLLVMAGFGLPLALLSAIAGLNAAVAVGLFVLVVMGALLLTRVVSRRGIDWTEPVSRSHAVGGSALSLVLVALLIQLVPYGRSHDNPAVVAEPAWDSELTRELAVKACFDCHSNEVDYPWYSSIAPVSWAVQRHVDAGRRAVNFSEWNLSQREAHESAETVEEGSMPPWYYGITHPGVLSETEKQDLIRGLQATLGSESEGRERPGADDDDRDDDRDDDD